MTPQELDQLANLSQDRQDSDAAKLRSINAEELKIRAQLAALDTTLEGARTLPALDAFPQRRVGGDLLWQRWVGRRRRHLQIQLARCLARKGTARRALQKSFGKTSALEDLKRDVHAQERHAKNTQRLDAISQISLLWRSR